MKITAWAVYNKDGLLKKFIYKKQLKPSEVYIKVKYCSLTRGDVRFIDNYWGDIKYPLVPGLEIIGTIKDKGDQVKTLNIHDIVGIGYQIYSCFHCEYCLSGKEQFCISQKLIPINELGGFADSIIIDYRFVFPMPLNMQTPSSTPLLCAGLTTFTAIKKAKVKKGMTVGVIGIGSLGHLALQFLNKMGCHVTAFSHSITKLKTLKELGAENIILSNNEKGLAQLERRYDFIISCSSENLNWELYIKALKPEGTLCFVGLPSDKISFKAELLADYAQKKIMGNYIGSRSDMKNMLNFASKNNIQAIIEKFPMEQVNHAIEKMKKGEFPFSAVLINK